MDPKNPEEERESIELLGLVAEDLDSLCTLVNRGAHRASGRSRAIRFLSTAIADLKEVQHKLFPESKVTRNRRPKTDALTLERNRLRDEAARASSPKEGTTRGETK